MEIDADRERVPEHVELVVDARLLAVEADLGSVKRAAQRNYNVQRVRVLCAESEPTELHADGVPFGEGGGGGQREQQHRKAMDHGGLRRRGCIKLIADGKTRAVRSSRCAGTAP